MTATKTYNLYLLLLFIAAIFVLMFTCNPAEGQGNVWYKTFYSNGKPTTKPVNPTIRFVDYDTTNHESYLMEGNVWKPAPGIMIGEKGEQGAPGKDGINGTNGTSPNVNVGATTTLPAGSQATVTQRGTPDNVILDFGIPKGQDGSGGSGSTRGMLFPAPCNCQTGADDATLQNAFTNAGGNTIVLSGTYYITKGLKRNQLTNTFIQGNGATIITLNNNPFAVIGADQAVDETRAIQMQNYSLEITNLNITCQSNQIGIEPEPSSNNYFRKVIVGGGSTAFKLEFNLKAYLLGCLSVGATNGFWVGWGGFPSANINNSQSNGTILELCHTHSVSNYGFDVSHSYHVVMRNCISEGNGTIKRAVNVEVANSNTTKDFDLDGFHLEQIGGATDAIVYLNLGNNCTAEITNVIGHYSGLVVWAKSSGTGLTIVNRCGWAVGKAGKMFKSESMTWSFNYNSIIYPYAYNVWDGTAPNYCPNITGSACGNNAFNFIGVIPR